jgi:hypothetical protein
MVTIKQKSTVENPKITSKDSKHTTRVNHLTTKEYFKRGKKKGTILKLQKKKSYKMTIIKHDPWNLSFTFFFCKLGIRTKPILIQIAPTIHNNENNCLFLECYHEIPRPLVI